MFLMFADQIRQRLNAVVVVVHSPLPRLVVYIRQFS
jgi:hypothetical protein